MKTKINRTQKCFGITPMASRGSFIAVALAVCLVPAMPLSAASADDQLPSPSRLQTSPESAGAQEAAKDSQRGVLDASGKPVCAELGKVARSPEPATGIDGEFTGTVGCGINGVYADAAPGAGAEAPSLNVATEVVWHLQWRTSFAHIDQAASPRQFMIAAKAH